MIPDDVETIDAYLHWFEHRVKLSGAYMVPSFPAVFDLPEIELLGTGIQAGVAFRGTTLDFSGRAALWVNLAVYEIRSYEDECLGIEQDAYTFHLATPDEPLVWRYDKHEDHHGIGSLCHVHLPEGDGEVVKASGEMDIDEVLNLVEEFFNEG